MYLGKLKPAFGGYWALTIDSLGLSIEDFLLALTVVASGPGAETSLGRLLKMALGAVCPALAMFNRIL